MARLTRRKLLKLTAAAVPALALGCNPEDDDTGGRARPFDAEATPESVERFPRTPIAGDMTDTRVVVAFYVADDVPVTFRMWDEDGYLVVDRDIAPSGDGFHKVMINALLPGSTYGYAVFAGDAPNFENRSLIGQVKTAPGLDDTSPVKVALLSCVGRGSFLPDYYYPESTPNPTPAPFEWPIFRNNADKGFDFLVHLGDQAYLDFVWTADNGEEAAYLHAWGFYHGGDYRYLYPKAGLYATWDDHEATDNSGFDPWDMSDDEIRKLTNAQNAWYKVNAIDAHTPDDQTVWRSFQWGNTVELILLDCRYELEEDALMSEAQLSWLLNRIRASSCRFICVATPKPFSDIVATAPDLNLEPGRWDYYLSQRDRVTGLIDELGAQNVIFVCGDHHMNYLGRLSESGDAVSDQCWEVAVTSGNTNPETNTLSQQQFDFIGPDPQFPVLTFDPEAGTVHVAFYAADGSLTYEQTLTNV